MSNQSLISEIRALPGTPEQLQEFEKHLAWLQANRSEDIIAVRLQTLKAAILEGNWPMGQY